MANASGGWVPYWRYDAFCISGELAAQVDNRFNVELREVAWRGRGGPPVEAAQIIVSSTDEPWFDETELGEVLKARHGKAGAECTECGIWRWMPLVSESLPVPKIKAVEGVHAVASPEWFGDGLQSFRQIAFAPPLAELIAASSPRDFRTRPWV